MKKLSIIVPCYNEEQNVKLFYKECLKTFKNYGYKIEIIFINDGSKDNTYKEIQNVLPDLVMMDKLYKEDGILTNMW